MVWQSSAESGEPDDPAVRNQAGTWLSHEAVRLFTHRKAASARPGL